MKAAVLAVVGQGRENFRPPIPLAPRSLVCRGRSVGGNAAPGGLDTAYDAPYVE